MAIRYPLPHIHDFTVSLAGNIVFTKLDLVRAYHQICVTPRNIPTANQQHSTRIGFHFHLHRQRLDCLSRRCRTRKYVRTVLGRFQKFGIAINLSKCIFTTDTISFHSYDINTDAYRPNTERDITIREWSLPTTNKPLQRLLWPLNSNQQLRRRKTTAAFRSGLKNQ